MLKRAEPNINVRNKKIIALVKEGHFPQDIASMFNMTYDKVRGVLIANKINTRFGKLRIEKRINHYLQKAEELTKQLGYIPTYREMYKSMNTEDNHLIRTCRKHLEHLGFQYRPPRSSNSKKYSEEFLLNHMRKLAKRLGRTPTMRDIKKAGKASFTTYSYRFGRFSNAQKLAGLVPSKRGPRG